MNNGPVPVSLALSNQLKEQPTYPAASLRCRRRECVGFGSVLGEKSCVELDCFETTVLAEASPLLVVIAVSDGVGFW